MDEMREIVDLAAVGRAIKAAAVALPLLCLAVGAIAFALGRRGRGPFLRALAFAPVGPLILGLWALYSHLVRFDPQTGFFGLDKLWVLGLNLAIFIAVGCAYGLGVGWAWSRTAPAPTEGEPPPSGKQPSEKTA